MLSVMTMAWRDAPAGTTAPFATAQTPEELRRRLFDAYVAAALNRRGKTTGNYTPEQTMTWLTWLARRMKEHGHTIFALEQLQPGWLEGTWRQFGYFLGSRLIGTLGLVLPFLFFVKAGEKQGVAVALPALSLLAGSYLGLVDFAFARHGWGGHRSAALRFWLTLVGLIFMNFGWMGLSPGSVTGPGSFYLYMVALTFCARVDVRALDIKPAGSFQWSRQLAEVRALTALGVMAILAALVRLLTMQSIASDHGWAEGWQALGGWPFVAGLALGGGLAFARWPWLRPPALAESKLLTVTFVLLGGQIVALIGGLFQETQAAGALSGITLTMVIFPTLAFYVFGGFGSTLIDPARPQQAGFWFWLRVPVLAFLTVGAVILLPSLVMLMVMWFTGGRKEMFAAAMIMILISAGCGLMAFLRFGGFNGAQHFLLRWLLSLGGHLPQRPEAFLRHAAQLALLQKVGLGYRFIHALLLQHLATSTGGTLEAVGPEVSAGSERKSAGPGLRDKRALQVLAGLGLWLGLMLLFWLGAAGLALLWTYDALSMQNVVPPFLGALMLSIALAIPFLLLTGRWLGGRSWRWLGMGWLGMGLTLAYLVHDEPAASRPSILAESATAFPGAEPSNSVLLRYSFRLSGHRNFKWTGSNFSQSLSPEQDQSWREFVVGHRAAIEANWQKLEPVRAWLGELNAFERIADLHQDLLDLTTIDYQVTRPLIQNSMARASLQALDDQGDAALTTLVPLLEVGGKLEEGARGTRYLRDARALQDGAIKAARFVLDNSRVSTEARARFAAALVARGGGVAGARRVYAARFAMMEQASGSFGRVMTGWSWSSFDFLQPGLNFLGPVFFNRQASLNHWGEFMASLAEFAARREPDQAEQCATEFLAQAGRPRFKNVGNSWAICLVTEPLGLKQVGKEQKEYWLVEDRRTALHARLLAP